MGHFNHRHPAGHPDAAEASGSAAAPTGWPSDPSPTPALGLLRHGGQPGGGAAPDQTAATASGEAPHLVLNLLYDSSMASAPAAFKAALNDAAQYLEGLISSNETVNIRVGYGEINGTPLGSNVLGEGGPSSGVWTSHAQFVNALAAHATSAEQLAALADMGSDPTQGGSIFVSSAEAKALGMVPPHAATIDGAVGFVADPAGGLFAYDPNDRAVPGKYDFIGVAEHELTHALGRFALLDPAHGRYSSLDLFRYGASGEHVLDAVTPGYFSIDGGATNLGWFASSSDLGDWAASAGNDAGNAYVSAGVANLFSQTDAVAMNVLGYALA